MFYQIVVNQLSFCCMETALCFCFNSNLCKIRFLTNLFWAAHLCRPKCLKVVGQVILYRFFSSWEFLNVLVSGKVIGFLFAYSVWFSCWKIFGVKILATSCSQRKKHHLHNCCNKICTTFAKRKVKSFFCFFSRQKVNKIFEKKSLKI